MEDLLGWRGHCNVRGEAVLSDLVTLYVDRGRPAKRDVFRRLRQEGSADELGQHPELIARLRRIRTQVREAADCDGSLENGSHGENAAEFVGSYRRQPHGCNAST